MELDADCADLRRYRQTGTMQRVHSRPRDLTGCRHLNNPCSSTNWKACHQDECPSEAIRSSLALYTSENIEDLIGASFVGYLHASQMRQRLPVTAELFVCGEAGGNPTRGWR